MRYFEKNPRAGDETGEQFLTRARSQEALSDRQIVAAERAALQKRANDLADRLIHHPPADWDALRSASDLPAEWREAAIVHGERLLRHDIAAMKTSLQRYEQQAAALSQWRKSRRNGA